MALRDPLQFHENPAAIAWWCAVGGRALVWFTPPARRRALLALAAVGVGTVTTLQTLAKSSAMPVPASGWAAALVVLAQFLLLWLVYRVVKAAVRAGIKDAGLVVSQPHMVRPRKPQDPKYDFVYTEPRSEQ